MGCEGMGSPPWLLTVLVDLGATRKAADLALTSFVATPRPQTPIQA